MADENYVRDLATTIKNQIESDAEKTKALNRRAAIIKSESPKFWTALKTWLLEAIGQVNNQVGSTVMYHTDDGINRMEIRYNERNPPSSVMASFAEDSGQISVVKDGKAFYAFAAKVIDDDLYYFGANNASTTLDSIGKNILDLVIKN